MSNQQKNNEEEIEIGSLFAILGAGIKNFFNFIGSVFKGVFDFLIQMLLFLKKHSLKIGIAAIIGGAIGLFLELNRDQPYGGDMLVQPNFDSTRQLYNNIAYYNDLVKQKDSVILAKTFNVTKSEAASFETFSIFPIENENDIINAYDAFILDVDTLTVKSFSFFQFKKAFTDFDYKTHQIHVEATNKNVFSGLGNVILSSIIKNQYFNKVKNLTNENLNRTDSLLRKDLSQTDTLLNVYKNVLLEKAKKENASTSIDLGGKSSSTKELELFRTKKSLNEDLKEVTENISEKSEVVNVISNFQAIGYKITALNENYAFQYSALGALAVIVLLLLLQLNKFLDSYKK